MSKKIESRPTDRIGPNVVQRKMFWMVNTLAIAFLFLSAVLTGSALANTISTPPSTDGKPSKLLFSQFSVNESSIRPSPLTWHRIQFEDINGKPFEFNQTPVVVPGPVSFNGPQAVGVSIRNITRGGFEVQLIEPEGYDGQHVSEKITYMAIEPGLHLINGKKVLAAQFKKHRYGNFLTTELSTRELPELRGVAMNAFSHPVEKPDTVLSNPVVSYIDYNWGTITTYLAGKAEQETSDLNVILFERGLYDQPENSSRLFVPGQARTGIPSAPQLTDIPIPDTFVQLNNASVIRTFLMSQVSRHQGADRKVLTRYRRDASSPQFKVGFQTNYTHSSHVLSKIKLNYLIAGSNTPTGNVVFDGTRVNGTFFLDIATLQLEVAADNESKVYLNGAKVLETTHWWAAVRKNFFLSVWKTHRLSVLARNSNLEAGVLANIRLNYREDNAPAKWVVLNNWQISKPGDTLIYPTELSLKPAKSYGRYGVKPWQKNVRNMTRSTTAHWLWDTDVRNDQTVHLLRFIKPKAALIVQ
ncbi:MAG: hypothetical protein R3194_06035 [Limnobacter sp.]|nr:hypothetical protein [Limnobacter sp.]